MNFRADSKCNWRKERNNRLEMRNYERRNKKKGNSRLS